MKITTLCAVAAMALLTVGCAGRASSIAPVAIASTDYSNMSCPASREALVAARAREAALTRKQNNAALADAASVALLFLPLGSAYMYLTNPPGVNGLIGNSAKRAPYGEG